MADNPSTLMTLRRPDGKSAELVITGKPRRVGASFVWDVSLNQCKLLGAQCSRAVLDWDESGSS